MIFVRFSFRNLLVTWEALIFSWSSCADVVCTSSVSACSSRWQGVPGDLKNCFGPVIIFFRPGGVFEWFKTKNYISRTFVVSHQFHILSWISLLANAMRHSWDQRATMPNYASFCLTWTWDTSERAKSCNRCELQTDTYMLTRRVALADGATSLYWALHW